MLTEIQKNKLLSRERDDPTERAKYDYIIAKKLKTALDNLDDISLILTHLPKHKLQKAITDNHVSTLFKATEIMMLKLDYRRIDTIDGKNLIAVQENEDRSLHEDRAFQDVPPSQKDLRRAKRILEHRDALDRFVNPGLSIPIPGYEKPTHWALAEMYVRSKRHQTETKEPGNDIPLPSPSRSEA